MGGIPSFVPKHQSSPFALDRLENQSLTLAALGLIDLKSTLLTTDGYKYFPLVIVISST